MFSLNELNRIWQEKGQHGSYDDRTERSKLWIPYYSYLAKSQLHAPFECDIKDGRPEQIVIQETGLDSTSTVLDIGAGTGGYALPFAKICRKVEALDICQPCLDVLNARAEKLGFDNINTVCDFWEEYRSESKFDLVFSAMCQAICDVNELERMESFSRKTCSLLTVSSGSYDKHRKQMMKELEIQPKGGMATESIYYYNALYLMGRSPNVKSFSLDKVTDIPIDSAMERYPIYFSIFGVPENKSRAFLLEYVSNNAQEGVLREESHMNFALITWNVR